MFTSLCCDHSFKNKVFMQLCLCHTFKIGGIRMNTLLLGVRGVSINHTVKSPPVIAFKSVCKTNGIPVRITLFLFHCDQFSTGRDCDPWQCLLVVFICDSECSAPSKMFRKAVEKTNDGRKPVFWKIQR